MPDSPAVTEAVNLNTEREKNANLAASLLLKQLGYNVDDGGPLYFLALASFLQKATDAEKKQAETPEGLLLVLHRRIDSKLNAEADKKGGPPWWVWVIGGAGILYAVVKASKDE